LGASIETRVTGREGFSTGGTTDLDPIMGVSGIFVTIPDKIGLVGEQNVAITWGLALKLG